MQDANVIEIVGVKKKYKLGAIGGGTLSADLQSWWAKKRGKEDPNATIGDNYSGSEETFYALKGIDFTVKKGEALGIIGGNGAGKSTLLKLLSRVTAPTEGEIRFKGRIASMLEVGTGFHGELTGRENIYMNGAILGMTKAEVDERIEDIIEFSECRQFIDTPVKRYSSGMYVKLAFAVAAHLDAEIMIMDEVLAVGDMKFQQKCLGKMRSAANIEGKTILYVSHNMNTIRQLCDRCIVLRKGEIIFEGDTESAIELYMGEEKLSESVVELDKIERASEFINHDATMTRLQIADNHTSIFYIGDKIQASLGIYTSRKINSVRLRIIVKHANGDAVTMAMGDKAFSLEGQKEEHIDFELDISKLAPGTYALSFVLFEVNDYGTDLFLDGLHTVYRFKISGKVGFINNMEWKHQYWGYIISNDISLNKR